MTRLGAAILLAGPAVLAFFAGGYFDVPRLVAALGAWGLVALAAVWAPAPLPRSAAARLAIAALAALALLHAVSAGWAPLRGPALDDAGRTALYLGALIAAAALLRGHAARAVEPALLAGIVVVAGYGLSERLLPGLVELERSRSAFGRLEQPLSYWNAMGALAAMGLVLALRLMSSAGRHARWRALGAAATPVLGAALLLVFSRGALLAAAAGILVLAVAAGSRAAPVAMLPGLAAAGLAGAAAAALPAVRTLDGAESTREWQGLVLLVWIAALALVAAGIAVRRAPQPDPPGARRLRAGPVLAVVAVLAGLVVLGASVEGGPARGAPDGATPARLASTASNRYEYWRVAGNAFLDHPVRGLGSGGFRQEWLRERRIADSARDAHSLWIETAAELGLAGLLLLGLLAAGVGVAARRALGRHRELAAGPVAALVAWTVHASLDWDWEMPGLTLVALVLAGLLLALAEDDGAVRPALRIGLLAAVVAVAVPLAAATRAAVLSARADAIMNAPGRLEPAAAERALSLLRRAQRFNPDPAPEVVEANLLLVQRRGREAVPVLERVLRAEPLNAAAWRLLSFAALPADPARAAQAAARARALAPRRLP